MVILVLSSVFFWNAWNELSVHVGFYWFCLLVFLCILMPPQQVYLCLVLLTVRLISCISDMLGLIGLVMGYCVTLCNVL